MNREQRGMRSAMQRHSREDLILYEGHVGIYMGDGKIINAMNEAQGIGVCSATYTNIVAVRRVL